jgi:hypothetical protein
MHCPDRRYQLIENKAGLILREIALINDYIEQLSPLAVLCYDILMLSLLEYFVDS